MQASTRVLMLLSFLCFLSYDASAQFGPDDYGYVGTGPATSPGLFPDISFAGTNITAAFGANLDDAGQVVAIGFSFNLYGTVISSIGVSTNGYLADDVDLDDFTNDCPIAIGITPNRGIYPFWDDLRLTEHGDVYVETAGVPGTQSFTVQWDDVGSFDDSTASLTFQAILHEQCGGIRFLYETLLDGTGPGFDASGGGATIGLESVAGTDGLQLSCNMTGTLVPVPPFNYGYTIETTSVVTPRFGVPPNPGTLTCGTFPGGLAGGIWNPTVSGALPAPALDFLIISAQPGINAPTGVGTFLCPISIPLLEINPNPGAPFVILLPGQCAFVGLELCTQGGSASFGPLEIGLTNGIDIRIGQN